jgi:uncharacterized oxidoreductase
MTYSKHTVLITGGGSGIGLELSARLVAAGNTVIICGRSEEKLRAAQQRIPQLQTRVADVGKEEDRRRLAEEVVRDFPALDVVINNAGTMHEMNLIAMKPDLALAQLREEVATNFEGPFHLSLLLLPHLRAKPSASIVNITTGYIYAAGARAPAYSATKTALHVMTQALRVQLQGTQIRVVEVTPPAVVTSMSSHYKGSKMTPEVFAQKMFAGLASVRPELRIGLSGLLYWIARLSPGFALKIVNPAHDRF